MAALVPMDGFHLANSELIRLGRRDRKGAIDTFDGEGYVAMLRRLRAADEPTVYANVLLFQRTLGHESLLVAINFDDEAMLVDAERLPGDGTLQRVFPARADAIDVDASGVATFRVGPRSVSVYRVERETVPA